MNRDEELEKFINSLDIVEVIGEYVTLKKSGVNYKGFSPFKEEKTPSFVVSPTKNIFKDFSTNIAGNVISFYMKINNMSFNEAVSELSEKYDVPVRRLAVKEKDPQKERNYNILKDAQSFFSNNIEKSAEALEYMEKRGFSKEELKKFGIGFSSGRWNDLIKFLTSKN